MEETNEYGSNGYTPLEFDVNLDRINVLLGTDFQQEEVMKVLDDLHLEPSVNNSDIHVKIPSYRMDLAIEADIAEEIIRILGYERLPSTMRKNTFLSGMNPDASSCAENTEIYFLIWATMKRLPILWLGKRKSRMQSCRTRTLSSWQLR